MARRPAAIHWQIARRIAAYARAGNADAQAVQMAVDGYRGTAFSIQDVGKISTVLDKLSFHQAGHWYGLLSRYLT